ncbi:MAG: RraA family protein [Betaproteobacteria bacterium]
MHKVLDPSGSEAQAIRQRYLKIDASTVADVLDTLGYQHQGIAPQFAPYPAGAGKLAGWAYTVCGEMRPYAGSGDPDKMKAVDGLKPGCVSVWSGSGEGICFFGELIALGMKHRGCTGALVDGGIRDIEWIAKQQFPVYARYRTPVQSIGRWKVTAWQVPAYLPGATKQHVIVNPGDFVLGDVDGVIVVPYDVVEKVLNEAERLTATEVRIRAELDAGATLEQVLAKYGHV